MAAPIEPGDNPETRDLLAAEAERVLEATGGESSSSAPAGTRAMGPI
jgi:hypothetical protein